MTSAQQVSSCNEQGWPFLNTIGKHEAALLDPHRWAAITGAISGAIPACEVRLIFLQLT